MSPQYTGQRVPTIQSQGCSGEELFEFQHQWYQETSPPAHFDTVNLGLSIDDQSEGFEARRNSCLIGLQDPIGHPTGGPQGFAASYAFSPKSVVCVC